jgi:hypothetical protein
MSEIVKENHSFELNQMMGQKVEKQPDVNSVYAIDFSMIESVNDLVIILASMGMAIQGNHPHIEQLKSEKGHLVESVLLLSGEVDDLQKEKADEQLKYKEEISKFTDFEFFDLLLQFNFL